jgi:ribosomal-protein-serine acetyltransferase
MNNRHGITIRPYGLEDFEAVYDAVSESMTELIPWMPWCHPGYSIDESRTWIESQLSAFTQGKTFEFAIMSASGNYLGGCGLNQLDAINRRANLGYWVRSSAAGHGVASAAVKLIRTWGFEKNRSYPP